MINLQYQRISTDTENQEKPFSSYCHNFDKVCLNKKAGHIPYNWFLFSSIAVGSSCWPAQSAFDRLDAEVK